MNICNTRKHFCCTNVFLAIFWVCQHFLGVLPLGAMNVETYNTMANATTATESKAMGEAKAFDGYTSLPAYMESDASRYVDRVKINAQHLNEAITDTANLLGDTGKPDLFGRTTDAAALVNASQATLKAGIDEVMSMLNGFTGDDIKTRVQALLEATPGSVAQWEIDQIQVGASSHQAAVDAVNQNLGSPAGAGGDLYSKTVKILETTGGQNIWDGVKT